LLLRLNDQVRLIVHGCVCREHANGLTGAGEAAVPVMWAACGVLAYTAWSRMDERTVGDSVETLLIV